MLRAVLGLVLLCTLSACINDVLNTKPEVRGLEGAQPLQTLINPTANTAVTLRPRGQLKLVLDSNPTTGYFWYVRPETPKRLSLLQSDYAPDPAPEGLVGSGGVQTFMFVATDTLGTETLTFAYRRGPDDVFETFNVNIKVID